MTAEINQLNLLDPDTLRIITMDKREYLGIVSADGSTIEYLKYCVDGFDISDLKDWLKKWNIEVLETVTLSVGQGIRSRKLNPTEQRAFQVAKERLLQAKKFAMNYWENDVFDKIG